MEADGRFSCEAKKSRYVRNCAIAAAAALAIRWPHLGRMGQPTKGVF